MEPRLAVEDLAWKSQVVGKGAGAGRVGVSGVRAEGIGVLGPHRRIVARAGDLAGGI